MKLKKLIIYFIAVIVGVCVLDVANRFIFTPFFQNPSENTKAGATYKFISHNEPAEVIVLGASRANHHYVTRLMEDSLGVPVYNFGWDGRCVLYQYLCLLKAIDNGDVRVAILDLSSPQLCREWVDDRISDLYPFYWSNDTVKNIVNEVSKKNMSWMLMSSFIQYNSQHLNFLVKIDTDGGYSPLFHHGVESAASKEASVDINKDYYSPIATSYLARMANLCKKRGIKLIACLSPSLGVPKEERSFISDICMSNDIECWDYTEFVTDRFLYNDINHLNHEGAILFTQEIIKRINI